MEYIVGIILVIIVIIIAGLLFRKRLYDSVDYYENWKIDIMGRNVAMELTRVKALNIDGEAKEKFEAWKREWDEILMQDLATVEEVLFDSEQAADRFKISTARKHLSELDDMLVQIEKKIDRILSEVKALLHTEKDNRKKVDKLEPKLLELRQYLSKNNYLFERVTDKFEKSLDEIDEDIHIYNNLIAAGSYSEATEIVEKAKMEIAAVEQKLEDFPPLYKQCKHELPEQLDELYKGMEEMASSGYQIAHLNLTKMINDYQARLIDYVIALEELEIEKVQKSLPKTKESIQEMFKMLENEALAKNFVESKASSFEETLTDLANQFAKTTSEVEQLKQAYHFEDTDLEKYLMLEKMIAQIKEDQVDFLSKIEENNHAHSFLRDGLEGSMKLLEKFESEHEQFKKGIQNLREDELNARKQIDMMMDEMNKVKRKLRQSNLPGVPNFILSLLDEAANKNDRVIFSLGVKPLDMVEVQKTLNEAKSTFDHALEQTNLMLDQARLTEQVIQYANRYRRVNPILAAELLEAEQHFHQADYELSLEKAATAIEKVEPGALKKIEKIYATILSS